MSLAETISLISEIVKDKATKEKLIEEVVKFSKYSSRNTKNTTIEEGNVTININNSKDKDIISDIECISQFGKETIVIKSIICKNYYDGCYTVEETEKIKWSNSTLKKTEQTLYDEYGVELRKNYVVTEMDKGVLTNIKTSYYRREEDIIKCEEKIIQTLNTADHFQKTKCYIGRNNPQNDKITTPIEYIPINIESYKYYLRQPNIQTLERKR